MLNPSTDPDYTGKVGAPTAGLPYGVSRDATFENDPAATPLLAKKFNDDWGFDAALMAEAEIAPSGIPDAVGASQRLDALRSLFDTYGTVADLAAGKFKEGARVSVTDRARGVFLVQPGGTATGSRVLAAGSGNTAVYTPLGAADPRAYGIGQGGDDTAALQEFVDAEDDWKGDPALVINLTSTVQIPVKGRLTADMRGSTIACPGGFVPLTNLNGVIYTGAVVGAVTRQTHTVEMDSPATAANFAKGDLVQLRSQTLWYYDNRGTARKGETHVVSAVSGSTVTVEAEIWDTYEATETLTLVKISKSEYRIKGLSVIGVAGLDGGVQFNGLVNSNVDIKIDGSRAIGLFIKNSYDVNVYGEHKNVTDSGTGYGVQISQSTFVKVVNSDFWNNRRGVDVSGAEAVSRMCSVAYCRNHGVSDALYNVSSGFGSHGSSDGTRFFGNSVWSCRQAFITRGSNETIESNFGFGKMLDFVATTDGAALSVLNNTYRSSAVQGAPVAGDSRLQNFVNLAMHDNRGRTVIQGNAADRIVLSFLQVSVKAGNDNNSVRGIFCTDNQSAVFANSAGAVFTAHLFVAAGGFTDATLKGCKFRHNSHVTIFGGQMVNYDPNLKISIVGGAGEANIVEGLLLTLVDENANTTGLTQRVFADILEDSIEIYGRVAFSTAAPASVKFSGFPSQRLSQNIGFIQNDYAIGAISVAYNGTGGNNGAFLLSSDLASPVGALDLGAHSIMLNFTYENAIARYF